MEKNTILLIEILKKYKGELTEEKIVKLTKIVNILNTINQYKETKNEEERNQMIIPNEEIIKEMIENELNETSICSYIKHFFSGNEDDKQIDDEMIINEWKQELNTNQLLQNILQLVSTPEVSKYIGKKFMTKLTETSQYIFTNLIGCINENVQMEVEEMEKEQREKEEKEKKEKENEVKNIPIDSSESSECDEKIDKVNSTFEERMNTITIDLDKIKRKFESFKISCGEYGENVDYFMEKERPIKEVENLLKRGIEVNELNMRIMLELDGFVGLNETNRTRRKQLIIQIQNQLDENETLMKKVKKTKAIVEKKCEIEEQKKKKELEEKEKENEMNHQSSQMEEEDEEEKEEKKEMKQEKKKKKHQKQSTNHQYVKPKDIKQEYEEEKEPVKQKSLAERMREVIDWNEMKFTPQFHVNEQGNTVIVSSNIPGMKTDDFEVTITKNGDLKISGLKKPTDTELNMIIKTVHQRVGNIPEHSMIEMVKRYCSGRYGSFTKIYELPDDIDMDNITMRYEEGVLRINLPKKVIKRQPNRYVPNGFPFNNYQSFNPFGGFW